MASVRVHSQKQSRSEGYGKRALAEDLDLPNCGVARLREKGVEGELQGQRRSRQPTCLKPWYERARACGASEDRTRAVVFGKSQKTPTSTDPPLSVEMRSLSQGSPPVSRASSQEGIPGVGQ